LPARVSALLRYSHPKLRFNGAAECPHVGSTTSQSVPISTNGPRGRGQFCMAKRKGNKQANAKMKRKLYEKELRKLQVELCHLQEWVKAKGLKIIIVFEGRDTAGKGGAIKAITERVSSRTFRVIALPAPSERQKSQLYIQRFVEYFPAAG